MTEMAGVVPESPYVITLLDLLLQIDYNFLYLLNNHTDNILQEVVKELQTRLKRQKQEIASRSTDVGKLVQKKEKLAKNNSELQLKIEETTFKIKELEGEVTKAQDRVKHTIAL